MCTDWLHLGGCRPRKSGACCGRRPGVRFCQYIRSRKPDHGQLRKSGARHAPEWPLRRAPSRVRLAGPSGPPPASPATPARFAHNPDVLRVEQNGGSDLAAPTGRPTCAAGSWDLGTSTNTIPTSAPGTCVAQSSARLSGRVLKQALGHIRAVRAMQEASPGRGHRGRRRGRQKVLRHRAFAAFMRREGAERSCGRPASCRRYPNLAWPPQTLPWLSVCPTRDNVACPGPGISPPGQMPCVSLQHMSGNKGTGRLTFAQPTCDLCVRRPRRAVPCGAVFCRIAP